MKDYDNVSQLSEIPELVDFELVVPQPRLAGSFTALVFRSRNRALLSWQQNSPGRITFAYESTWASWGTKNDGFRAVHHDGREMFVLGPDDPRGGQAVGVWVGETAVKLSGHRTIKELITIAHSLRPYRS